jgi:hypothetical protein
MDSLHGGSLTLLTSQWKAGKTTPLSGKSVVLSEEPALSIASAEKVVDGRRRRSNMHERGR